MTERKRDSPRERALRRIIEEIDDVLEDEALVISNRNVKVIGCYTITLAVLDDRTSLVLLRNLDVLRNSAEDLVGLSIVETDEDEPRLRNVTVPDVRTMDVALERLRPLGREATLIGLLDLLLRLLRRNKDTSPATVAIDSESLATRLPRLHVDSIDRLLRS